ncbi:S8 family serine peptidase [Kribbella sp. NPDC051770]|uniref:S8 family serine peptidase n=1 Tax=Kribbella sp. NPDC051770 TaxID=3155413 RepID=UPI00342BCD7E
MNNPPKRWGLYAVTGVCVLALSSPLTAQADPAHPVNVPSGTHTVTLITGDVVTTRESGANGGTVTVTGPDGGRTNARVAEAGGDLYVYPEVAIPYVAQGVLDRRLFNVSDLVEDGYDDAHRDNLPLIVSYTSSFQARQAVPGATQVRSLTSIQGAALTTSRSDDFWTAVAQPAAGLRATASGFGGGIAKIWLDGVVKADLSDTTAQIGAPEVWAGGDTGQGVDVAVLDTGVDTGHPDLAGRIAATRSFVPDEDVLDRAGHGTHVASTIAGTGAASDGKEQGVAPGAELHIGKVLANSGSGQDSWLLAGMEWAAVEQHAKVVNMSLGSETASDGTDPVSEAVNRLSAQTGALFVVAAGNTGQPDSISAPGAADAALTVGAVDGADDLAYFSSQGPRVGDGALKPEITAPGVDVLAARSQYVDGEGAYQTMSGTSMATPHVAGAAALLAAKRPDLTGAQLKDLLASSSKRTPAYNAFQAGSGRLDVAAAVRSGVFASATAYAGLTSTAVSRPVTYTNTTDAAVTLKLSVDAPDAPAGVFRLSATQAVVPAHGTASVNVTITATSGRFTGQIVATDPAGTVVAHTAISIGDAAHKLTMNFTDAKGEPMSGVVEVLKSGDDSPMFFIVDTSGTGSIYLANAVYSVLSFKDVTGVHGPHSLGMSLLGDPDVTLDRDRTVNLDVRKIRRVEMTTPQPAETTYQRLEYNRSMGGRSWRDFMETQTSYDSLWAQPTTHKVTNGDFFLGARWRKEQPALSVSTHWSDFTDVLRQDSVTSLPKGRYHLPLVFAGDGGPADYAKLNVRNKAVVVRRNDAVSDADQAANAAKAGAKLLLVQNNQLGRQLRRYSDDPFTPAAIDVALLSTDEGEKLIQQARRGTTLEVESQPAAAYVYDLMQTWHQQIPSDPVVKGSSKNLARVDVSFHSPDPARGGGEYRYDWPSYSNWAIGLTQREPVNGQRVDWVSTTGSNEWGQEAYVDGLIYEIEPRGKEKAGGRRTQEWFKPVARPFLNNNYKAPSRSGSWLSFDIPAYGGGSDHVGMSMDYDRSKQTLALYQGSTLLGTGTGTVVGGTAPATGKLPYRLVVDNTREESFSPYSSRTSTTWTFTSKAPADDVQAVLPLVQLDYKLSTDSAGRAKRNASFTAVAQSLTGARTGQVELELSYDDGKTWQRTRDRHDGRFQLDAPRHAKFVSLRASARDSEGNTVHQTVIRAAGLVS